MRSILTCLACLTAILIGSVAIGVGSFAMYAIAEGIQRGKLAGAILTGKGLVYPLMLLVAFLLLKLCRDLFRAAKGSNREVG